jgi:hypothetical protein
MKMSTCNQHPPSDPLLKLLLLRLLQSRCCSCLSKDMRQRMQMVSLWTTCSPPIHLQCPAAAAAAVAVAGWFNKLVATVYT